MPDTQPFTLRELQPRDRQALLEMWGALWPEDEPGEHVAELDARIAGAPPSTLPLTTFVAEAADGQLLGFVEVGLRSHANGCDPRTPVAFIEGWFVVPGARRRGVGTALIRQAEAWGREQGAIEIASDTWYDEQGSVTAHQALGFEVVDRCVNFKKNL